MSRTQPTHLNETESHDLASLVIVKATCTSLQLDGVCDWEHMQTRLLKRHEAVAQTRSIAVQLNHRFSTIKAKSNRLRIAGDPCKL